MSGAFPFRGQFQWLARLILAGLILASTGAGITGAQGPDGDPVDWTTPYRPALLPDFVADMAAHADAPRYTLDLVLTVDDDGATLSGQQRVTVTNRLPGLALEDLVFRLLPNLHSYGAALTVSRVALADADDRTPLEVSLDETESVLRVPLPAPLAPGAAVTLALDFRVRVPLESPRLYGQFSYSGGVLALPTAYPVLSVYEPGSGWWQETAHPQGDITYSETAFYDVRLIAPAEWVIAASGSQIDAADNGDGTLTHRFAAPLLRDFALVASPHYAIRQTKQDGVTLTAYFDPARPDAAANAADALRITADALRIFNAAFGPYPHRELDIVQTMTSGGGIEYPGLFVISAPVWDANDAFFEFLVVHETAHQWWYSLVGNDQAADPWIDEALAQFATALYIRALEGDAAYQAALASFRREHAAYLARDEVGGADAVIGLPVSAYRGAAYFYMVYQKGPLFYAALDERYGTEGVLALLRDLFAAYRYEIVEPVDLLVQFEASTGDDLDALFAEWVGVFAVG